MVDVSNAWSAVQTQTLQPETFVEIKYSISEPGVQEDAVLVSEDEIYFSDVASVIEKASGSPELYPTLEYGVWGLSGEFPYFDGSPENPGYVSNSTSGEDGVFENPPVIKIQFEDLRREMIPGVTITWDSTYKEWAVDFRITAYNSDGVVAQTTVVGNSNLMCSVALDMVDYTRVEIEILKWCKPYHRARCDYIFMGITQIYTKSDLLGFEHRQSVDLLSAALPNSEVTFRLRNDTNVWNPDDPKGFEKYLLEQQQVDVRYGMLLGNGIEWIKGGTFWLTEWNTPNNGLEANFIARDAMSLMNDVYTGIRVGTLYDVAMDAFEQASLPLLDDGNVRYIVDESLKSVSTNFESESGDYTIAEVLQMVAHAGCCVLYQDRDGMVRIEPWDRRYSKYRIDQKTSYTHPEYSMSKPLKGISVDYGDENRMLFEIARRGEIQTVSNPLIVTEENAEAVGTLAKSILGNRKVITGEYRADLRLDALDNIMVTSKYASNVLGITDVSYSTTGGTFRGTYTGRVVSIGLEPVQIYSNEVRAGEVW